MKTLNAILFTVSLVSVVLLYLDLTGVTNIFKSYINSYALTIGLIIPFSLLFLGYVFLRQLYAYLLWLSLGVGMLLIYYQFRHLDVLQLKRGSSLESFKSLFYFLIAFRLGNTVLQKATKSNYVTPSIGGTSDLFESKKPNWADYILFIVLFLTIILAQDL